MTEDEKEANGIKKARPQGRAGFGAGVERAVRRSSGHVQPRRGPWAVVEMHVVMVPGAHERMKGSRDGGASQLHAPVHDVEMAPRLSQRLHFGVVVNNFTYCG